MAIVAVLGCGPAGLFAAQACELHGVEPIIMSRKVKSHIYGAQYLHQPIPDLSPPSPSGTIKTVRLGTREGYAQRVYGSQTTPTSWDKVQDEPLPAWDLRETYDAAWDKFEDRIADMPIEAADVASFSANFDLVISAIPLWTICEHPEQHHFSSIPILVKKEMEYTGLPDHWTKQQGGVVYNGTDFGTWYRTSYIFGHASTEAIARDVDEMIRADGWDIGYKIAGTDCDCHPNVVKAGRMGSWERGVLTHHAFEKTIEAIYERAIRAV